MSLPPFPLTKQKYKTRTSSQIFLFAPLKLNFIALSQRTRTCSGWHCLEAQCVTNVSPPLKKIDFLLRFFVWEPLALVFSKCFTNSLAFTMSHVATQAAYFLMVWSPFHQILFCTIFYLKLGFLTLEDALLPHVSNHLLKVGRWPTHLLVIGPQCVILKCL